MYCSIRFLVFIFLLTLFNQAVAYELKQNNLIGIIVPKVVESTYLRQQLKNPIDVKINGVTYTRATLNNKQVVLILCGVGEINSAIFSTKLIENFHPRIVYMIGSAGAVNSKLKYGDVVIGRQVINADLGTLTDKGPVIHAASLVAPAMNKIVPTMTSVRPYILTKVSSIPFHFKSFQVSIGRIATTDILPNPASQYTPLNDFKVDVVEMEGASLMVAALLFDTPALVIRGVSDTWGKKFTNKNEQYAAKNATKVLISLINQL